MHISKPSAMKLLDLSRQQIDRLFLKKELKYKVIGRRQFTTIQWIIEYLDAQEETKDILIGRYKNLLEEKGRVLFN